MSHKRSLYKNFFIRTPKWDLLNVFNFLVSNILIARFCKNITGTKSKRTNGEIYQ